MTRDRIVVFVDPSAGYKGAHNAAVMDLLAACGAAFLHEAQEQRTSLVVATNRKISPQWKTTLETAGIPVIPAFDLDGYQLSGRVPSQDEVTPYVAALGTEFSNLFESLQRRWQEEDIHLVYHTMSWEQVMALASALRMHDAGRTMVHHVFLMYWPGVDEAGTTVDAGLRIRYRIALSRLGSLRNVRLYTGTAEYQEAFRRLAGDDMPVDLHPAFLDDWSRPPAPAREVKPESVRKILAYSGDVRMVKGFAELPSLIDSLREAFPFMDELIVHLTTRSGEISRQFQPSYQAVLQQSGSDGRIKVVHRFLTTEEMNGLIGSIDLVALNYQRDAYRYKTSGFLWLAARLGKACVVPENTWMAREAQRLGVPSFSFEENELKCNPVRFPGWQEAETAAYRTRILQPFAPWLDAACQAAV